jgi:hypothetical protein
MRKIITVLISMALVSTGSTLTANATEPTLPQPDFFYMSQYTDILQGTADTNRYKCKTSLDPTSGGTEIFSRCTKPNLEIYLHGNNAGQALSYASFTAKKATAYPNLEFHFTWCAGKAGGGSTEIYGSSDWIKANYKKVTSGKKLSKVFAGLKITITGGSGATRTISCGVKPS